MKAHTLETQATITPDKAFEILKIGNQRFVQNLKAHIIQAIKIRDINNKY